MADSNQLKQKIHSHLMDDLEKKISGSIVAINSLKESRDNESKSTAGDKHETGRAMVQIEIDNNENQLKKILIQKNELSKIDLQKKYDNVEFGSLVLTDTENYFISIGAGKIKVENGIYFAISLASPIGMLLKDKKAGEKIKFNDREIIIREIV